MDFPSSCLTGVLRVDNYHAVSYSIIEVIEDDNPNEARSSSGEILPGPTFPSSGLLASRSLEGCHESLLRRLESSYRRDKKLATAALERRQLWVFGDEATSRDHLRSLGIGWDDTRTTLSQIDGLKLKTVKSGIFNAAALGHQASISGSSKANPASAPPAPVKFEQKVSASRLSNAKAASVNKPLSATLPTMTMATVSHSQDGLDDLEDPTLIYMHFIASIVALLSYCLTESLGYIPLNGRTLVNSTSLDVEGLESSIDNQFSQSSSSCLTTLDVRLTTTGILLIAPQTTLQPGLVSLAARAHNPEGSKPPFGGEVWLAPGGRIARCLGTEYSTGRLSLNGCDGQEGPFRNTKLARGASMVPSDAVSYWKEDVRVWLEQKGIYLKSPEDGWARVEIWTASDEAISNDTKAEARGTSKGTLHTILWPDMLCFERVMTGTTDDMLGSSRLNQLIPDQKWLAGPMEQSSEDPLVFAEIWYAQREARQEELRIKTEARQAEQYLPKSKTALTDYKSEEILPIAGLAIKQSTTGDISAASGVYPTPPDGVQTQALSGVSSFDPAETPTGNAQDSIVSGTEANSEPVLDQRNHEGSQMDLDVWPMPEGRREGTHERKHSATVFELGSGNFSTGDGGAFFGHLDEDMFNEIGVTEADFSFFDNPDLAGDDLFGDGTGSRQRIDGNRSDADEFKDMFGSPSLLESGQGHSLGPGHISDARTNPGRLFKAGAVGHLADQIPDDIQSIANGTLTLGLSRRGTASLGPEIESLGDFKHSLGLSHDIESHVISPPLSPDLVMKKLLPERPANLSLEDPPPGLKTLSRIKQQESAKYSRSDCNPNGFDSIQFNSVLDDTKGKYDLEGRFWFSSCLDTEEVGTRGDETLPRLGPRKTQREATSSHAQPEATGQSRGLTPATSEVSSEIVNVSYAQNESKDDQAYIRQVNNVLEDYSPSAGSLHLKRKRKVEDDGDSMASSLQQLAFEPGRSSPECPAMTPIPLDYLDGDPADWSMAGIFSTSVQDGKHIFELSDKEFIYTAQLVADQVLFRSLNSSWQGSYYDTVSEGETPGKDILSYNGYFGSVEATVQKVFPQATECDLRSYVAVEDALPVPPVCPPELSSRSHPRPKKTSSNPKDEMSQSSGSDSNIFKIQPPHTLVQRGDTRLQILPSALHFWESFGLGPCSGPKDITSFCVYPPTPKKSMEESVDDFLERMGSVYESCRLGRHRRGNVFAYNGGCVPVEINAPDPGGTTGIETAMQAIKDTCFRLGELLPNLDVEPQNVVIYLINPFSHRDAIVDLCFAFSILFHAYLESPVVQQSKRVYEVVLQIVPLAFVASDFTVPVPTPLQFFKLAMEVYERCALTTTDAGTQVSFSRPSPAVLLAQSIPNRINFKLSSEPPQSLLDESCCLHIAYSCSMDDRWVSVAWSDNYGDLQTCTSFCLTRREAPAHRRPFSEVAKEVWETSVGMIQFKPVAWRFLLVKVGVMDPEEIEVWAGLASQPTQPPSSLVVVSADPCPPLSLHTQTSIFAPNDFTPQTGMYTTPVSTPQPNTQSPDSVGNPGVMANGPANAGTGIDGAAEPDGDATITDVIDEVWAVVLNHRVRNSNSVVDFQPALASGLLVKRGGVHEEDSPVCLGVNILHAYQSYGALLKEILGMYRGLYTLARFRGVVDPVKSVLPWHVATAIKAQEALSSLM